jgi:hypothetical protein
MERVHHSAAEPRTSCSRRVGASAREQGVLYSLVGAVVAGGGWFFGSMYLTAVFAVQTGTPSSWD